ncbi:MAG: NAD(P)-dependent oxidoreductase [Planctomycetota bacterium]|jgi:phosphoglycerate dehydrogenase-like enzyme
MQVFFTHPPRGEFAEVLAAELDDAITVHYGPELPPECTWEILVGGRPSAELLDASPQLRAVVVPYVGIPMEARPLFAARDHLTVHNLHHNAAPTAEMCVTLLLTAAKKILPFDQSIRENDWSVRYGPPEAHALLLEGKTALVLGLGAIGRRVARACKALGMHVLATRRTVPDGMLATDDPDVDEIHPPEQLDALVPRSHALLVCLPETSHTSGLIRRAQIDALRRPSVLVNVGRASIVDEGDLYGALYDRSLDAAGLDVWYRYPESVEGRTTTPPSKHPFHALDNVVMSPHRGGLTDATEPLRARHLAALLNQAATGAPIDNQVDLGAGY